MQDRLTSEKKNENMIIALFWGCFVMNNIFYTFEDSEIFRLLSVLSLLLSVLAFSWFKVLLFDEFVHSFWLKRRMKLKYTCIYGFGVDECFVLTRLAFFTGALVCLFVLLNSIDFLTGMLAIWSIVLELIIGLIMFIIFCIQLHKYESAFSNNLISFVASCVGVFVSSILAYYNFFMLMLFFFFSYCFIYCAKEIMSTAKMLESGDHVVVRIDDTLFDSKNHQFYLIFYSKTRVKFILRENHSFRYGWVTEVISLDKLPKLSDTVRSLQDDNSWYERFVLWILNRIS